MSLSRSSSDCKFRIASEVVGFSKIFLGQIRSNKTEMNIKLNFIHGKFGQNINIYSSAMKYKGIDCSQSTDTCASEYKFNKITLLWMHEKHELNSITAIFCCILSTIFMSVACGIGHTE